MNIKPFLKTVGGWIKKNSTKLLTVGAIGANVAGYCFMHKEAPIVRDRLKALPEDAGVMDKIKTAGPVYLPAAAMLLISSACTIGCCAVGDKRAAILSTLATTSQAFVEKYEKELVEKIGPEKVEEAKAKAIQETIKPEGSNNKICDTGYGTDIFYIPLTGTYFMSSPEAVRNAIADFNRDVTGSIWGSVAELCDKFGINENDYGTLARYFGWNTDDLYDKGGKKGLDVSFEGGIAPNGHSCQILVMKDEVKLFSGERPKAYFGGW